MKLINPFFYNSHAIRFRVISSSPEIFCQLVLTIDRNNILLKIKDFYY